MMRSKVFVLPAVLLLIFTGPWLEVSCLIHAGTDLNTSSPDD